MVSTTSAIFVCYFIVAIATTVAYSQSIPLEDLASESLPEGLSTQARNPDMLLIALCWDGQNFMDECQKHKSLLRQLLYKLMYKMKGQKRQSENDVFLDEQEAQDMRMPAKRRRDDTSGFYSNW